MSNAERQSEYRARRGADPTKRKSCLDTEKLKYKADKLNGEKEVNFRPNTWATVVPKKAVKK